jgi:hypothetical protein
MRKFQLALAFLLIATVPVAAGGRRAVSRASFVPPDEPGVIYTVIDFDQSSGKPVAVTVNVAWGSASRRVTVAAPYRGICSETTPSGFVLKMRHPRPDSVPMTITTNGVIVREPYQGDLPLELLSSCYRLVT